MAKGKFEISTSEMERIESLLSKIMSEFEENTITAAQMIINSKFYKEGSAKKVFDSYDKITEKSFEVYDHYARASQLVQIALADARALDDAIANKIQGNMEMT